MFFVTVLIYWWLKSKWSRSSRSQSLLFGSILNAFWTQRRRLFRVLWMSFSKWVQKKWRLIVFCIRFSLGCTAKDRKSEGYNMSERNATGTCKQSASSTCDRHVMTMSLQYLRMRREILRYPQLRDIPSWKHKIAETISTLVRLLHPIQRFCMGSGS